MEIAKCAIFAPSSYCLDCKTVGFFLSKSVKKSVKRLSPVSLSVFSLVRDLLFDCSRVLEYAKVQTVLQSTYCWPIAASRGFCDKRISSKNVLLLVFSVTPFKIDQNKNQKRFNT